MFVIHTYTTVSYISGTMIADFKMWVLSIMCFGFVILSNANLNMNLALECSNRDFTETDDPLLRAVCESSLYFADEMQQDLLSDQMIRRSSGGNYIRFGRTHKQLPALDYLIGFGGRDKKDGNYMRFGRSLDSQGNRDQNKLDSQSLLDENKLDEKRFMRFGRGAAKTYPSEKRFMRFGRSGPIKRTSGEKGFMRFGRDQQKIDLQQQKDKQKKFMRFGRDPMQETTEEAVKRFMRFGKRVAEDAAQPKLQVNFSGDSLAEVEDTEDAMQGADSLQL